MNRRPMTIEELRELNPTPESPVRLECDDDFWIEDFKTIDVIAVGKDKLLVINGNGREIDVYSSLLQHYPSLKPEPKTEILYECWTDAGYPRLFFEDGSWPDFDSKYASPRARPEVLTRKTGRTLKLNMDTWEIES